MEEDADAYRPIADGYLDWAATLAGLNVNSPVRPGPRLAAQNIVRSAGAGKVEEMPDLWEQLFVRSEDPDVGIDAFFESIPDGPNGSFYVDPFDIAYARAFRRPGEPVDAILFRRRPAGDDGPPTGPFEEVAAGGFVSSEGLMPAPEEIEPPDEPADVLLGIVDDGLPILNARFTRNYLDSRFEALWSQVLLADRPGTPATGTVETRAELNTFLGRLRREGHGEIYRERAEALFPFGTGHALNHAASHGSIMLDLAAGAPPQAEGDMIRDVPILGVQLPPQSFDDTSGRRLELPLLQAIRWMLFQTFVPDRAKALVINASLGIVAGPKNGRSFLEQQIKREIDRAIAYTGRDDCVHLTLPYGNAYDDRLVGEMELAPGTGDDIMLRLLPDDRTPSYVEIRVPSGSADFPGLEIGLRGPDPADDLAPAVLPPGTVRTLPSLSGRMYHIPPRNVGTAADPVLSDGYILIAFAPSAATIGDDLLVRPGAWQIELRNPTGEPVTAIVQVQRDDSPYPRQTGARQAYLDHPNAHVFDPRFRDFGGLAEDGPVTHAGTNSAYSTVPSPQVNTAGGAVVPRQEHGPGASVPEAAQYSAMGADWSGERPDGSAVSETGWANPGVRAAGLGGAATARLSGTSAASATVARDLLLQQLGSGLPTIAVGPDARLGTRLITKNPAIRS